MIKSQKHLFFWLTALCGILLLWPFHDFQYWLAQGDHGRELYAYKKVWQGALPYRDFSWVFGPLLPYYFGSFFILFGENIQSILAAQMLLMFGITLLIYLISVEFITPALAFVGALWYICFRGTEFFHSYHHSGGVFLVVLIVFFLFRYIKTKRPLYNLLGFAAIFLLMLTRLNLGLANLVAFIACLLIADFFHERKTLFRQFKFYCRCTLGVCITTFFVYYLILHAVPDYVFAQAFPYNKGNLGVVDNFTLLDTISSFFNIIWFPFTTNIALTVLGIWLIFGAGQILYLCVAKKLPAEQRKNILVIFGSLLIFLIFNLHEFLLSNTQYRMYWAFPIILMLIHFIADYALKTGRPSIYTKFVQWTVIAALFYPVVHAAIQRDGYFKHFKTPQHLIHIGPNKIYTTQDPGWISTVKSTADYINQHVPKDAKIFALPHASLYYFLTQRDSGTRQLDFFEHNSISPQQEKDIIAQLQANNVNWIIVSNRVNSMEARMGIFGVTHCPLIAQFVNDHFELAAEYGNFEQPGGWAWDHATRILKRKVD